MITLRRRVALALVAVVAPLALAFGLMSYRLRREAVLDETYAAVVGRMDAGARARCEEGRPPRPPSPDRPPPRGRPHHRPPSPPIARYDASFRPSDPGAPPLERSVGEAIRRGERAVFDPSAPPRAPRIVLRMPWDQGPCAVVVVPAPRGVGVGALARDLGLFALVLTLSLASATLALGPPLRRLGLLHRAVASTDARGLAALDVPAASRGDDEVGLLSEALARGAASAREHLADVESRDAALREYVDGTTHDLAIPITVLQGHLAALADARARGVSADASDLDGASASVQHLAQLTANLATVARLEGDASFAPRSLDLAVLAARVVERLRPLARARGVELAVAVPDVPVVFEGDELLLERALSNLVHNAVRHRRGPGHVAVLVEGGASRPLRVTVKGDGAALDDATLAALEAGMLPPDPSRTRGRGLGLRIVRHVAALHGLRVTFRRGDEGGLEVSLAS